MQVVEAIADALEVPRNAVFSDLYDAEIESAGEEFVRRQSLEQFIRDDEVADAVARSLRALSEKPGGPKDVARWRELLPLLASYAGNPKPAAPQPDD